MPLPENITKDHLLRAIKKINIDGIPPHGKSSTYDVVYEGEKYPPKLVVSYANIYANGKELDRASFEGGRNTECFDLLRKYGFKIETKEKETFYNTLIAFLKQSQTTELKTNSFPKSYRGLDVKVSFGQGNPARIPWIAFTGFGQKVSNGIYPVYLYYKKQEILILAYGLSETISPQHEWLLNSSKIKIEDYFDDNFKSKPERYGESFVYKVYKIENNKIDFGLNEKEINPELDTLIDTFKKPFTSNVALTSSEKPFEIIAFQNQTDLANLKFNKRLITRFVSALCTKPFVILTGLAGSGKTKLAQAFATWVSESEKQICIAPVGSDWTNRDPILGYPNALEKGSYVNPENGALDLLIRAGKTENEKKPYFLILDEMNLSHVERYFADFLSAMESGEGIPLHPGDILTENKIPAKINLPKNLFIIGTVNIDETTYMFSPKVLDRASVIEFKVNGEDMEAFLVNPIKADLSKLTSMGKEMAADFLAKTQLTISDFSNAEDLNKVLLEFFRELKKVGAEFGYRTATEINRFAGIVGALDSNWKSDEIIDAAVMQKLLPKIHGSRRKIESTLKILAALCLIDKEAVDKALNDQSFDFNNINKVKFPISLEKISRMYRGALQDGFTSFAEA